MLVTHFKKDFLNLFEVALFPSNLLFLLFVFQLLKCILVLFPCLFQLHNSKVGHSQTTSLVQFFYFKIKGTKERKCHRGRSPTIARMGMSHELTKKLNYLLQLTMQDITSKRHCRPMYVYQVCKNKVMIKVQ